LKIQFKLDKQKDPINQNGVKVSYGEAKRSGYRIRWYLLIGAILLPTLIALYWILRPQILTIAPAVISYNPLDIRVTQQSVVDNVYVTVGDQVSEGDPLVKLRDMVLDEEIEFLLGEIIELKEYADQRDRGRLALFERAKENASNNFSDMEKIKQKYDKYNATGQVSTSDYASILTAYNAAQTELSQAAINLREANIQQADEDMVGAIAALIRQLEKELALKRSLKEQLIIKAPYDLNVINVLTSRGERIEQASEVITITSQEQAPEINAYLDAKFVLKAQLDNVATVKLPNGNQHKVRVSKPTQLASKLPQQLAKPFEGQKALLLVTLSFIQVPEKKNELIEGMPVEVYF
jgi:multidrug resistance efflux pump